MTATLTIHKFGGAALADAERFRAVAALVAAEGDAPRVIVASAMAGVTDDLLLIARAAATTTTGQSEAAVARVAARHRDVAQALGASPDVTSAVEAAFAGLRALADDVRRRGAARPRDLDAAAARGEWLSALLLEEALRHAGVRAQFVDATEVIATDGVHGHATADRSRTARAARAALRPLLAAGAVPVVPGFIGAGHSGDVVTLGRGGSDLSATLIAGALGASRVVLWKDVPGLLTADPRVVPGARVIRRLHVREAAEIAHYGARVLHPATLAPLASRTRVFIRPFADPTQPGTELSTRPLVSSSPVRAVVASMDQAIVTLAGRGLAPRPAIVARAFLALDSAGIGASLISQSASEYAFAFTVPNPLAATAVEALRTALVRERTLGEIETIDARLGVATVGIVGSGIATEPGIAARVFGVLGSRAINVIAAAQGSGTGCCLSIVVDATAAAEAQRAIHGEFQLHRVGGGRSVAAASVDIILLGAGAIGRELLAQLGERGDAGERTLRVCGVVDRSGWVFSRTGFSRRTLGALRARKSRGIPLANVPGGHAGDAATALEAIAEHALSRPILVDATAAETSPVLESALLRGWDVVLANKVPLAAGDAQVRRLLGLARERGRQVLHEATVGAGLPVIDTLRKLQESGDRILRIEGCPSGTLGFLFGELGRGRSFSDALRAAMRAGYTEPDPRLDLSGLDVARKALILGRLIGFSGDLADVATESLVPDALRDVPLPEFLEHLGELDAAWEQRVRTAAGNGCVLRYRARVMPNRLVVGLVEVPLGDPMASLTGTDNQFAFTTTRYRRQPLVITGPGAGSAVTAAGVLNDIMRLAAEGAPAGARRRREPGAPATALA